MAKLVVVLEFDGDYVMEDAPPLDAARMAIDEIEDLEWAHAVKIASAEWAD